METLALISPIYSLSTYLLCALVLMWISVYFRRAKQFKENVWLYSAKVVPLWVGLVAVAFLSLFIGGLVIRKAFVGMMYIYSDQIIALTSLSLCAIILCIVFFFAIRRKQFAHSYKIFTLYFLLSVSFIFLLTMIASNYEVKEYKAKFTKENIEKIQAKRAELNKDEAELNKKEDL